MAWNDTKLSFSVLQGLFNEVFSDSDIPKYTADDLSYWCAARFAGFFPLHLTEEETIEALQDKWTISRRKCAHLVETTQYTYNPIENYSMTEEGTDSENSSTNTSGSGTVQNKQATYLSSGSEYPENSAVSASSGESSGTATRKHTFKRSGNIGVTTSQQMIQAERDLAIEPLECLYHVFVGCFQI